MKTSSDPCAEYSAIELNVCVWLLPAFTLDDIRNRSMDSSLALNVASPSWLSSSAIIAAFRIFHTVATYSIRTSSEGLSKPPLSSMPWITKALTGVLKLGFRRFKNLSANSHRFTEAGHVKKKCSKVSGVFQPLGQESEMSSPALSSLFLVNMPMWTSR